MPLRTSIIAAIGVGATIVGPCEDWFGCEGGRQAEHASRARFDVRSIEAAAEMYLAEHEACPHDVSDLVSAQLFSGTRKDPWGTAYWLTCDVATGKLVAHSAGPDRLAHTEDDVLSGTANE